jgi:hypothetical protein
MAQDKRWETWRGAFRIEIRLPSPANLDDPRPANLDDPRIVCTSCGALLAYLADGDNVASLMTLAAEHTCPTPY